MIHNFLLVYTEQHYIIILLYDKQQKQDKIFLTREPHDDLPASKVDGLTFMYYMYNNIDRIESYTEKTSILRDVKGNLDVF